jgi:hypothetical protein
MGPRVYAVRTGDRYGPEFEDYIDSKVPNVTWIREETIGKHQWNKLIPMSLDIDEPVCVIDIDVSFINDYMDLFNYPIERGQFVATQSWWKDTDVDGYKLQGGFQKYYPKDCKYIYDKFVSDSEYWMEYYIKNGTTCGPVNGEQYFVEDSVKERLKLKFLPETWMTNWNKWAQYNNNFILDANLRYPGEYLFLGEEFNPDVRLLHFQGSNTPHKVTREVRGW